MTDVEGIIEWVSLVYGVDASTLAIDLYSYLGEEDFVEFAEHVGYVAIEEDDEDNYN